MQTILINGIDASADLVEFTRDLVRIQSYPGQEEQVARFIAAKMLSLGYDEVKIDRYGNVVGRIGDGEKIILFDSHTDTVEVQDEQHWDVPPFSGEIVNGELYGRGAADMKAGLAASVYAAAASKSQGLVAGKTVYVSCSVQEENCDGEGLKHVLDEIRAKPDFAIICEPSSNIICTGHKGKAQIIIRTQGISAHGASPEKGKNAIYEMAEIIQRVEQTNLELMRKGGKTGTLVMSQISSTAVSLNAVPSACQVYLDRRMAVGETEQTVRAEVEGIIAGKAATWELGVLHRKTWTGEELTYVPLHMAWEIDLRHPLAQAFTAAYSEVFGRAPETYDFWDYSTNAVAVIAAGIPTIGFGPGDPKMAHMRNERCPVSQIAEACAVYVAAVARL